VRLYRRAIALFAATFICLGFALLIVTALRGGGTTGFLIGALFIALGTARLYLLRRG
jgi:hypothetical protein